MRRRCPPLGEAYLQLWRVVRLPTVQASRWWRRAAGPGWAEPGWVARPGMLACSCCSVRVKQRWRWTHLPVVDWFLWQCAPALPRPPTPNLS